MNNDICGGNGICLMSSGLYDNDGCDIYMKKPNYDCKYSCKAQRCSNYIKCKTYAPGLYFNYYNGLCMNCYLDKYINEDDMVYEMECDDIISQT